MPDAAVAINIFYELEELRLREVVHRPAWVVVLLVTTLASSALLRWASISLEQDLGLFLRQDAPVHEHQWYSITDLLLPLRMQNV